MLLGNEQKSMKNKFQPLYLSDTLGKQAIFGSIDDVVKRLIEHTDWRSTFYERKLTVRWMLRWLNLDVMPWPLRSAIWYFSLRGITMYMYDQQAFIINKVSLNLVKFLSPFTCHFVKYIIEFVSNSLGIKKNSIPLQHWSKFEMRYMQAQ